MPGPTLTIVDSIPSTSDTLKARADHGAPEQALMARRQTAGHGRLGRPWHSVDGNLYLSVLLRPTPPIMPGHWSLLAAVVVHEIAAAGIPHPARLRLKWPNDVLLSGAKVAGLLLDAGADHTGRPWLVIGIGVNLAAAPPGLDRPVASLAEAAPPIPAERFARSVLDRLEYWRTRYQQAGFPPVRDAWLFAGPDHGTPITVQHPAGTLTGAYAGLRDDGALLLAGPTDTVAITSGEADTPHPSGQPNPPKR